MWAQTVTVMFLLLMHTANRCGRCGVSADPVASIDTKLCI